MTLESRYFIYDAKGNAFGNINGYLHYKDARGICTRNRYKLWSIYDEVFKDKSKNCDAWVHLQVWDIRLKNVKV